MSTLTLNRCEVDLETGVVLRSDQSDRLTKRELALLRFLSEHDRVVGKEELLVRIWDYHPKSRSRTVDTTVRRLRAKLDDVGGTHLFTVYGQGYRFLVDGDRTQRRPSGIRVLEMVGMPGSGRRKRVRERVGSPAFWVEFSGEPTQQAVLFTLATTFGTPFADPTQVQRWLTELGPACVVLAGVDGFGPLLPLLETWIAATPQIEWVLLARTPLGLGKSEALESTAEAAVLADGARIWGLLPRLLPREALRTVLGADLAGDLFRLGAIEESDGEAALDVVLHERAREHPLPGGPERLAGWWLSVGTQRGASEQRGLLRALPWVERHVSSQTRVELLVAFRTVRVGHPVDIQSDVPEVRLWRADSALRSEGPDAMLRELGDLGGPSAEVRRAYCLFCSGDLDGAAMRLAALDPEALPLAERASYYERRARVGRVQGQWLEAERHYALALELFEAVGDDESTALVYTGLGNMHLYRGSLRKAREAYERALTESVHQEPMRTLMAQANLSLVLTDLGQFEASTQLLTRSLEMARGLGLGMAEAVAARGLTFALAWAGNLDQARHAVLKALALSTQYESPAQRSHVYQMRIWLDAARRDAIGVEHARRCVEDAGDIALPRAFGLVHLGLALHATGDATAVNQYAEGIDQIVALGAGVHAPRWCALAAIASRDQTWVERGRSLLAAEAPIDHEPMLAVAEARVPARLPTLSVAVAAQLAQGLPEAPPVA